MEDSSCGAARSWDDLGKHAENELTKVRLSPVRDIHETLDRTTPKSAAMPYIRTKMCSAGGHALVTDKYS